MVTNKTLDNLLLAVNMNTNNYVQLVSTITYSQSLKKNRTRYALEYLKIVKLPNEEGENKRSTRVINREYMKSRNDVATRLSELLQEGRGS